MAKIDGLPSNIIKDLADNPAVNPDDINIINDFLLIDHFTAFAISHLPSAYDLSAEFRKMMYQAEED